MTAQPGRADPTDAAYHGLVLCDECNGEEAMPDCKCKGEGWLLNGQPVIRGAIKGAFAAMYSARKARRCAEIPARFAVIEEASARVAMALGKDDSRVTELLAIVRDLLPAPASGWQDERPTEGKWYVAIAPERRWAKYGPVEEVEIDELRQVWLAGSLVGLIDHMPGFVGAKWKRRVTPEDPFKVSP